MTQILERRAAGGPPAPESYEQDQFSELYRPLDTKDRPWMEQLGCEWPQDNETEWLTHMNGLLATGRENLREQTDEQTTEINNARHEFAAQLPLVAKAHDRLTSQGMASRWSLSGGYLPSDKLIATMRLLDSWRLPMKDIIGALPATIIVSA